MQDALRLYIINSPVVRAEPLRFKKDGVFGVVSIFFSFCLRVTLLVLFLDVLMTLNTFNLLQYFGYLLYLVDLQFLLLST